MRQIRYFLAVLAVFVFAASHPQTHGYGSNAGITDTAHYYMKHSFDVLKYELDADLYNCYQDTFSNAFPAKEVITFRVDSGLNAIRLNALNFSLEIRSVGLSGTSFIHKNDTLVIRLDSTYKAGAVVKVSITYLHRNVIDHGVYSDEGFLFTDNPPEGARKWLPCWDRPSDKALFELMAKVPKDVRLASNGSLADSSFRGDTLVYHWVSRDPMATYLLSITSRRNFGLDIVYWHRLNHPADSIPVRFYFQVPKSPKSIEAAILPMTDFYSRLFGEYPFEKIGLATLNSSFPWGGMENQSLINLKANGWDEALVSHEFSHQWFGDLVTCGTWADIWLNESIATYCESLWLEYRAGKFGYKNRLDKQADYYLKSNPGFAIYNPSWAIHTPDPNMLYNTPVIYYKGACVMHQLRYVMGDSAFFHLLKAYATDTSLMFKNAVTPDFMHKANEVSKTDLEWFFDEWLKHPNHPLYENTYTIENEGKGVWKVKLMLTQYQANSVFYKMPVQVKVIFEDATDTVFQVFNDRNQQVFDFPFSKKPADLFFDPYRNILLKQATTSRVDRLRNISTYPY